MRAIIGTCIVPIFGLLMGGARWAGAGPSLALTVAAGQSVTVPAPGVIRAETSVREVAEVVVGTDAVTVRGLRPGTATLMLTLADGIEGRPVQVVEATSGQSPTFASGDGCFGRSYITAAGSHVAIRIPSLEAEWSPGFWQLSWSPSDVRVSASSALVTPLQQLGIPVVPGVRVLWDNGWGFIASDAMNLVGYKDAGGTGTIMLGNSSLGPVGEMEALLGDFSLSTAAILLPSGQVLNTASTSLNLGPFTLGYKTGTGAGSATMQVRTGPVTLSAAASPSNGVQVGLGSSFAGVDFQGSWMVQGGWRAQVGMSVGLGSGQDPAPQNPCWNAQAVLTTPR